MPGNMAHAERERALALARESERILLSGHLRADGDCLGAQAVLFHAFRALGKECEILLPDPPDGRYGFLREKTPWAVKDPQAPLPPHDLLMVCDCSRLSRLGEMGALVEASEIPRIALDHHPLEEGKSPWTALFHDLNSPASGLLALELSRALGVEPGPEACEAAFTALMTDTGWLKYSNAGPVAWEAAASLVAGGVDTVKVYHEVYQRAEPGRPRGIAAAMSNLEYHEDGKLALAWVDEASLDGEHASLEDTDEVLDLMRAVDGVEAVAFLMPRSGLWKASLRSLSVVDVNEVAETLGGGGHARASGVMFPEGTTLEEARGSLLKGLQDALRALP